MGCVDRMQPPSESDVRPPALPFPPRPAHLGAEAAVRPPRTYAVCTTDRASRLHRAPMSYLVICAVAFVASGLTFFSGFGLGTLLLPAFALFVPVGEAVALTGVVHGLNGVFKLALVRRSIDGRVLLRFGAPAVAASLVGALLLARLAGAPPLLTYEFAGGMRAVTPVKLAIGGLLLAFAGLELSARFRRLAIPPRFLPLGGLLSGFFGGLSGMQGALRSAFLLRAGLSRDAFIATGVAIAVLIDVSRLGVYIPALLAQDPGHDHLLAAAAVASAFAGAALGNRCLRKLTMAHVQRLVAALLFAVGIGLVSGLV